MSRPQKEKCRLCSKLSAADAQQRHGPEGTGCWDATHCHQRRGYYRHRSSYNSNRRQNRRAQDDNIEVVPVPAVLAAVLYLYRQRVDTPIHALGAELWLGQEKKAAIAPVHCFGLTAGQIAAYLQQVPIAADAWERDLTRAVKLYTLIAQTPSGFLPDSLVPTALKAGASVGQTVENAVLRDACNWLGIDPDAPINRRQGRPRSRFHNSAGEPTNAGQYIELTLRFDGTVTGRLIASFHGFSSGTNLATLTLTKLASMLVALREGELIEDADLLEAYLDAVDPDWRAKIAEEIGVETSSTAMNPWTILGVEPGASLSDVKRAYKRIMRTVHPDASGMPRWFAQTVNDAYRKLLEELERE